jgi:thiol-disulfide isomerase/thioredoxin
LVAAVAIALVAIFQPGVGGTAPDFRVVVYQGQDLLGGDRVDFSQVFEQDKPVVLNFWAGLCPPCRQEMPGFQRVYDDLGDSYVMVGVDIGPFVRLGSHDDARRFLRDFGIRYPTGYAVDGSPVDDYGVVSMPTTLFLTPDRQIFDKRTGFLSEDLLRSKLSALLEAASLEKDATSRGRAADRS